VREIPVTLIKAELIDSVRKYAFISRPEAAKAVETLLEIIKKTLEDGEDVLISRFGKFCVKEKDARRGRNPHTGNDMTIGGRRVVIFRCSGVLRDKINANKSAPLGIRTNCR